MSTASGSTYLAQRRRSPRSRGKEKGAEILSTLLQTCFLYLKHMQKDQKLSITAVRRFLQLHAVSISQTSCVNLDKECKLLLQSLNESFQLIGITGLFCLLNKLYLMEERQRCMQMSCLRVYKSQQKRIIGARYSCIIKSCKGSRIKPIGKQL